MKIRGTIKTLNLNNDGTIEFTVNPKDKVNSIAVSFGDKPTDITGIFNIEKPLVIKANKEMASVFLSLYQKMELAIFEFKDFGNELGEFVSVKVPANEG